jgi:hypothetical protein
LFRAIKGTMIKSKKINIYKREKMEKISNNSKKLDNVLHDKRTQVILI